MNLKPETWNLKLFFLPAHAVFGVFEDNAALGEFVPNFIATRKVAAMTRFLPLINQRLNFFVEQFCLRLAEDV